MDSESSLSSSSSSCQGGVYEVFLSFRGPDIRRTFADFLYSSLDRVGIRTFLDEEGIRKGEKIESELYKWIGESRISIPIFSKQYASSKWCLRELTHMLHCKGKNGQSIRPIFYDVEPHEVRHQSGDFGEAFKELASGLDQGTILEWRKALEEVGALNGWHVKNEAGGHQGKLIMNKIVPEMLRVLNKNSQVLPHKWVEIYHHENEIRRLLEVVANDVPIVGIHGMCGIGKTTIAKVVFNQLLHGFDCSCFLENVRETVQHQGVVCLLNKLLNDTLISNYEIKDADTAINTIRQRLLEKKVLIVLDDMDENKEFNYLIEKCDWLGAGSRIIVTTRDKHVLKCLKVSATYEPPFMNFAQSLQLFNMHAFTREFPPEEYVSIAREIASTAAGLPLALKVVGSFLHEKQFEVWKDTQAMLEKLPHDEVEKKLRISYVSLSDGQQQIFLDTACLFSGMDTETVFYMWDDCEYHPITGFSVLSLRSLVKMGDANELTMHDQLKALGRKIVCKERILGRRSRLWNHEEAVHILEARMGTDKVEALSLCFELESQNKPRYTRKEFKKLFRLRYLRVDGVELSGDFDRLLSELRWLTWRGCPPCFKPTNFCTKNLVILDLSNSGITEDWEGWNHMKMANKLKVLQLTDCALRKTPDFSSFTALEKLILRRCGSLIEIDPSIGNLKNLKVLDISYAGIKKLPPEIWMLEKLEVIDFTSSKDLSGDIPNKMGRLSSLEFLSFHGTKIKSLPTGMCKLSRLQTLNLGYCTKLQLLPELPSSLRVLYVASTPNLTNLVNLEELNLAGGCGDSVIPREFGLLSKLETLTLDSVKLKTLPEEIGVCSRLKILNVQFCKDLEWISALPSSLVDLSLAHCGSLKELPDLSNLENLLELTLYRCNRLESVEGLGKLLSLTILDIDACDMVANVGNLLSNLKKLEVLCVTNCLGLYKIQELHKLKSLKYLDLRYCENLREIEGLEALESLEALNLSGTSLIDTRQCKDHHDDSVYRDWIAWRNERLNSRRLPAGV